MQCETAKKYLPFYFYNDMEKAIKSEVKSHIKNCENCRREFKYLKRTLEIVNKEGEISLPFMYRKTLLNKILQATQLREERESLQRKRIFVFSSSFATVLILFFFLLTNFGTHNANMNWQNNSFTYGIEELRQKMVKTDEITSGEIMQISSYSLNEKIESIYGEIEELTVFSR